VIVDTNHRWAKPARKSEFSCKIRLSAPIALDGGSSLTMSMTCLE
jgi:hypothetical protein